MGIRRSAALLVLLGLVAGGCGGGRDDGSTLRHTWVDRTGSGELVRGPGEERVARTALAPASKATATLAVFAQITDAHVVDEESPARLEMLDRFGSPFTSAFRPQESLSGQVLAAAVASVNALKPDAVVETGDLIDNAQRNELDEAIAILDGGRVDPSSGSARYEGVEAASNPDPFYYRPDVDPPRHPGVLADAQQPFASPGLEAPWYPVVGNHDVLVQGNYAPSPRTNAIAVGSRKLVTLDPGALEIAQARQLHAADVEPLLTPAALPGRTIRVSPDPRRAELPAARIVARLRTASAARGRGPLLDYAFALGRHVVGIVLDTIPRGGGTSIVSPSQLAWLEQQLARARDRYVIVFTHAPLPRTINGDAALSLLDADPHVVAAVAGDVHRNEIEPRRVRGRGYWLITTASLADYPQQARAFRLVRTVDGGVVLQTWMLDTDPRNRLARISRELAYLDYQGGRVTRLAGERSDRNADLYR